MSGCPSRECYPGTICNKTEEPCCTSPRQCTGISGCNPLYLFIIMHICVSYYYGAVISLIENDQMYTTYKTLPCTFILLTLDLRSIDFIVLFLAFKNSILKAVRLYEPLETKNHPFSESQDQRWCSGYALGLRSKRSGVRYSVLPLRFQKLVISCFHVAIWLKDR